MQHCGWPVGCGAIEVTLRCCFVKLSQKCHENGIRGTEPPTRTSPPPRMCRANSVAHQVANSAAAGGVRQRAGEDGARRLAHRNCLEEGAGHTSVSLRDPYLTQVRFWDSLQGTEKDGSSGRTRTYNPPVRSDLPLRDREDRHHCASCGSG